MSLKRTDPEVHLLNSMGDDLAVVNAARVSFSTESQWNIVGSLESYDDDGAVIERKPIKHLQERDVKLIRYLADHNHWSPFSHCYLSFRVKAPMFVARQLQKHVVGLAWNEVSRRYVDYEPEFYLPLHWRERSDNAKQGSKNTTVIEEDYVRNEAYVNTEVALDTYNRLLGAGVCPEQARMVLPQNTMTEWIWSGSLYAFARVCNLRLDSHTQRETQDIAKQLYKHIVRLFPVSSQHLIKGETQ